MFHAYTDVPGYLLVFPLIYGAFVYFALAMARHLRVVALARRSSPSPAPSLRIGGLLVYALGQAKMFRDPRAGAMHVVIFWGFVILSVGTADIATAGTVQAVLAWPLGGAIWSVVATLQNLAAAAVLVALTYAAWRRLVTRPTRLTLTRDGLVILGLIAGIVASEVCSMALQAALTGDRPGAFITNALGALVRSEDRQLLDAGFVASWWAHMILVAGFVCYLPGSKHLHIVTSFFNVYLRKLTPRGELPAMDLAREDQAFGARTIADLGRKDLLDAFTCTECGRCQDACPASATGKPLSPKAMVMGIRHMAVMAEAGHPLISLSSEAPGVVVQTGERTAYLGAPIVGEAITFEAVWDCVTCGACVEACPVLIEHVDKIVDLRRNLVLEESRFPPELGGAFRHLEQAGNPWGEPQSARGDWTLDLPFAVHTVADLALSGELDSLEVLYWVGCSASYDDRNRKIAGAMATCLHAAGVRFAILGREETCIGDPARRTGNEYLFQMLAAQNIDTLARYGMERRTIVTTCPHCYNTIANEYGQLGGYFEVVHHAVYLQRLIASGRLQLVAAAAGNVVVTLHDSCYLSRYNDVVAEPRALLAAAGGIKLREMSRSGRNTFCCGAGGGHLWMEETRGTRINAERTRDVLATGARTVVTECPYCMTMIRDGIADAGQSAGIATVDLAEILAQRVVHQSVDRGTPAAVATSRSEPVR